MLRFRVVVSTVLLISLLSIMGSTDHSTTQGFVPPANSPLVNTTAPPPTNYTWTYDPNTSYIWEVYFRTNSTDMSEFEATIEIYDLEERNPENYVVGQMSMDYSESYTELRAEWTSYPATRNIFARPFDIFDNNSFYQSSVYGRYEYIMPSDPKFWESKSNIGGLEISENETHYIASEEFRTLDGETKELLAANAIMWTHAKDDGFLVHALHESWIPNNVNGTDWHQLEIVNILRPGTIEDQSGDSSNFWDLPVPLVFLAALPLLVWVKTRTKQD